MSNLISDSFTYGWLIMVEVNFDILTTKVSVLKKKKLCLYSLRTSTNYQHDQYHHHLHLNAHLSLEVGLGHRLQLPSGVGGEATALGTIVQHETLEDVVVKEGDEDEDDDDDEDEYKKEDEVERHLGGLCVDEVGWCAQSVGRFGEYKKK